MPTITTHLSPRSAVMWRASLTLAFFAIAACSDDAPSHAGPTGPAPAPTYARGGNGDNNGRIVFQSNRDEPDGYEIYSMNPDGTGVTRLTNSPGFDRSPSLSPDGKRVVFESRRDDPSGEIYVMNADGTGVTRLTYSTGLDRSPVWSKDGKRIAFESTRDSAEPLGDTYIDIYIMNADGSQVTRLTSGPGLNVRPSWSADGKQIAFASDRAIPEVMDVYAVTVADRQVARLTFLESDEFIFVSWSPDGKRVAFSTDQVFVVNVDDKAVTQLTTGPTPNYAPSWMDGGKKIVFTSFPLQTGEIVSMNADGSGLTPLTANAADDDRPSGQR